MKQWGVTAKSRKAKLYAFLIGFLLVLNRRASAQSGVQGINDANALVRTYFDAGITLMYAIGAVIGIIGAVRVYQKWSNGHPDTGSTAAAWFGSCIFLIVVATVLKSFFNVT